MRAAVRVRVASETRYLPGLRGCERVDWCTKATPTLRPPQRVLSCAAVCSLLSSEPARGRHTNKGSHASVWTSLWTPPQSRNSRAVISLPWGRHRVAKEVARCGVRRKVTPLRFHAAGRFTLLLSSGDAVDWMATREPVVPCMHATLDAARRRSGDARSSMTRANPALGVICQVLHDTDV